MGPGVHTKQMERAVDLQAAHSWPGAWRLLAVLIGAGVAVYPPAPGGRCGADKRKEVTVWTAPA